ncbi:MAG: zf-HC2 domain-containing protein [Planctomycetota bacterium]
METNTCAWIRCQLPRFVDGELTDQVSDQIATHLGNCNSCQKELEDQVASVAWTIEELVPSEPRGELGREIAAALPQRSVRVTRSWWPNAAAAALLLGTVGLLSWFVAQPVDDRGEQDLSPIVEIARSHTDTASSLSSDDLATGPMNPSAIPDRDGTIAATDTEETPSKSNSVESSSIESSDTAVSNGLDTNTVDDHSSQDSSQQGERTAPNDVVMERNAVRIVPGDVDADGVFTQRDVLLLSAAVEQGPEVVRCAAAADFDGDDELTPSDLGQSIFALSLKGAAPSFEVRQGGALACDLAMCP